MTSNDDSETTRSRRSVVSAVASSTFLGGCLATAERANSPLVRSEPSSSAAETRTSTQTDTPAPTTAEVPNETEYPVDHPNERENNRYGPLISYEHGSVRPVGSRTEWQQLVTEGPTHGSVDKFLNYEFITQTDFDSESIVVIQQTVVSGKHIRLQSVRGIGTSHLWFNIHHAGEAAHTATVERYVFVRIPEKIREAERITAEVRYGSYQGGWADTRVEHYVYWDSNSRTQPDVRTRHESHNTHYDETDYITSSNLQSGDHQ